MTLHTEQVQYMDDRIDDAKEIDGHLMKQLGLVGKSSHKGSINSKSKYQTVTDNSGVARVNVEKYLQVSDCIAHILRFRKSLMKKIHVNIDKESE